MLSSQLKECEKAKNSVEERNCEIESEKRELDLQLEQAKKAQAKFEATTLQLQQVI